MQTIDVELVERTESKVNIELEKANNVKDGIRAGPIQGICTLLVQVLMNFEAFD